MVHLSFNVLREDLAQIVILNLMVPLVQKSEASGLSEEVSGVRVSSVRVQKSGASCLKPPASSLF